MATKLVLPIVLIYFGLGLAQAQGLPPLPQPEDEERIQTGEIVQEIPLNMVGLKWKGGGAFCTATLIAPDRILTAAHCTQPSGSTMEAVLGLLDISEASVRQNRNNPYVSIIEFTDQDIVNNPGYEGQSNGHLNDVSIIKLKSRVKSIFKPIYLASASSEKKLFESQSPINAFGWGKYNCNTTSEKALRTSEGMYIDGLSCSYRMGKIDDSQLCMLYWNRGGIAAALAPGDSGGPVVVSFGSTMGKVPFQIGVASYVRMDMVNYPYVKDVYTCTDKSRPQVYTRVSSFQTFIQENAPGAIFANIA